jgi:hypothetical protein
MECGRATIEAQGMFRTTELGKIFLELHYIRAKTKGAVIEGASQGGIELFAEPADLRGQIKVRYFIRHGG